MPSPRELDYWICDVCSTEIRDEDDLRSCGRVNWNVPRRRHVCTHDTICIDCTFNCTDCGLDVCKACAVEIPSDGGDSTYRCWSCQVSQRTAA